MRAMGAAFARKIIRRARSLVRSSGFEPPRYCYRQPLKLVRLPVPPRPLTLAARETIIGAFLSEVNMWVALVRTDGSRGPSPLVRPEISGSLAVPACFTVGEPSVEQGSLCVELLPVVLPEGEVARHVHGRIERVLRAALDPCGVG